MSEDDQNKTWLERLSEALMREPQDRKQLISLLYDAHERNILDEDALHMIEGALQVSEMKVRDAMVPRSQMVVVEEVQTAEQALPIIIESAHSRFPVIGAHRDQVTGILLAKDLLRVMLNKIDKSVLIRDLVRPVVIIPESKRLNILLREFRLNRNHMAVVVDEYGAVAGLITIEDVLEQIVGDIEDEYDIEEEGTNIKRVQDDEFSVNALTEIYEFNEFFRTNFSDETFDTIGGLILQKFGHLPSRGESITIGNLLFIVTKASNRTIELLRIKKLKQNSENAG